MRPSDKTTIFNKIRLCDNEVSACFCHYRTILGDERIAVAQQAATNYAKTKAQAFFSDNVQFFESEDNRTDFFKYISAINADKANSGKRFSEELYKLVCSYAKQMEEEKENI